MKQAYSTQPSAWGVRGGGHITLRGSRAAAPSLWNWILAQHLPPLTLAPPSDPLPRLPLPHSQKCPLSHHESTLLPHLLTWAKFLAT